jgi:hypothetical protein
MLVRRSKPGETVVIGHGVALTVVEATGGRVRLASHAPDRAGPLRAERTGRQDDPSPPAWTAGRIGQERLKAAWRCDGPAANSSRPGGPAVARGVGRLRRGVPANTTSGVSEIKGEGETRPRKAGERILAVGDNRDPADSLRLWLEVSGQFVPVACSGHDGARAAGQYQPDVVPYHVGRPGPDTKKGG